MTLSWNDQRVERLTELWREGVSASQIAKALGLGRNAVLGKARHLKLQARKSGRRAAPRKAVLARALAAQGLADQGDMTEAQLLEWFDQAAPGERISYFRGNLARARAGRLANPALVRLADAARALGTPQIYEQHISSQPSRAPRLGQGLAHLAQRRITAGKYEYFITKAREAVVA
jgi:hypothetical protein